MKSTREAPEVFWSHQLTSTSTKPAYSGTNSPTNSSRLYDLRDDRHPTVVSAWRACGAGLEGAGLEGVEPAGVELEAKQTHFGVVAQGLAELTCEQGSFQLTQGMFFCVPGKGSVKGNGAGIVTSLLGYQGLFQVGGPVESVGRLRYIDGCSDTVLVHPPQLGDPCLNLLSIPPRTNQTAHTHPSIRVGVVLAGRGTCQTKTETTNLEPGLVFIIRAHGIHSFHTDEQSLLIVAWHPDSDSGPTDDHHPMVNRTYVNDRPIRETEAKKETAS